MTITIFANGFIGGILFAFAFWVEFYMNANSNANAKNTIDKVISSLVLFLMMMCIVHCAGVFGIAIILGCLFIDLDSENEDNLVDMFAVCFAVFAVCMILLYSWREI